MEYDNFKLCAREQVGMEKLLLAEQGKAA